MKEKKKEGIADRIRRAEIANITKKVAAGKTLTSEEHKRLDAWEEAEAAEVEAPGAEVFSASKWMKFWRVSRYTIYEWIKANKAGRMPRVTDVPGMLKWEAEKPRKAPRFTEKCKELRAEMPPEEGGKPRTDEEWVKFRESGGTPKDDGAQIKTLEMFRDGYAMKLDAAMSNRDMPNVRQWNALLIETTNAIRQSKLAAEKLGYNEGELISFEEMDRIIFALGFWLMRGVDLQLESMANRCAKVPPNSDARAYRAVLEPVVLSEAWATPWAKASKASGVSLPARAIEKFRKTCGDYLSNGEQLYLELCAR